MQPIPEFPEFDPYRLFGQAYCWLTRSIGGSFSPVSNLAQAHIGSSIRLYLQFAPSGPLGAVFEIFGAARMVGAPRLWARSGQCQPCSYSFQHVSLNKISCSRIWSSTRVHPTSTHSQPAQNRSARLSQTGACKPSLCGCFASRTRSSTLRR